MSEENIFELSDEALSKIMDDFAEKGYVIKHPTTGTQPDRYSITASGKVYVQELLKTNPEARDFMIALNSRN